MTELSRNLIAAAREGLGPSPDVAARVRARVLASVGAPAAAVATATPAKTAAGAAGLKLAGVVIALAVVASGVVLARRHATVQAPRIAPIAAPLDEPASKVLGAAAESPAPEAPHVAPATRHVVAPVSHTSTSSVDEPITLAREVELLDRAMQSLRTHAPEAALDVLATYEREARGHGQMAEDAAAIVIEAHCALHHPVADRLAHFDRAYPSSAQRERLQTACYGH